MIWSSSPARKPVLLRAQPLRSSSNSFQARTLTRVHPPPGCYCLRSNEKMPSRKRGHSLFGGNSGGSTECKSDARKSEHRFLFTNSCKCLADYFFSLTFWYLRRKRSTRPAVSISFCFPVKKG